MTDKRLIKIALAGNPNAGKTSIFNGLTGAKQKVANFPGVTVEKRIGYRKYKNYDIMFVDLPGTYSLTAYSLDEKVARDFILDESPDLIINVIDSGNLERSLYLTMQLIEMGVDVVLDLNMWDEVQELGIEIDTEKLTVLLGAPVVKTIGSRGQGIESLLETSIALVEHSKNGHRHPPVSYGSKLDDVVLNLSCEIQRCRGCEFCRNPRWLAIKLLEGDKMFIKQCLRGPMESSPLAAKLNESINHIKTTTHEDPEIIITEGRYGYVAGIIREVMKKPLRDSDRMRFSQYIDNTITHRILGYPIFLIIMWLIFLATFRLGQYPMEWIDSGVTALQSGVGTILPAGMITDLLVDGIIGGVGSVIVFLPNIVILFLGISILEDSGYMARAAFLMDRLMHILGLHGKSFIPMLMGFGCSVPAIMATRTLESEKDRVLTTLLIPYMSCSAKLPVYVLFAAAFFGAAAGNAILSIYIIGIVLSVVAARVLRGTLLRGESLPFVMELPPYRWPTWKSVAIHMWERSKIYLRKMGGVILIASIILWALGYFPRRKEYSQDYETQIIQLQQAELPGAGEEISRLQNLKAVEELKYTLIGRLGYAVGPVVAPLGFNWQMGVSLLTGFVAKEVVVSSMGVLYQLGVDQEADSESLIDRLRHPESGISKLAAFAFMVFVLLYTPCIVSIAVVRREIGVRWMWFTIGFQLAVAYICAFIVYQGGKLLGL
nr:ferrous iron transport protein B [candidate division Zixibacteria bacterium]